MNKPNLFVVKNTPPETRGTKGAKMAENKKKYTTIGTLKKGQYGEYIELGQNGKNEKYNFTVDIRITKADGTVQTLKNVKSVNLFDPRNRPGISEDEVSRIPDWKLKDLSVSSEE